MLLAHQKLATKFPCLRKIKNYLYSFININKGIVRYSRPDLNDLPQLIDISPMYVKKMKMDDNTEMKEWLNIINQSFSKQWGEKKFDKKIKDHEIYKVINTYFLMDEDRYVGVISEAV